MIGAVVLPIGIFWFAWTAAPVSIPWIVSIIAGVPFGFGIGLIFLSESATSWFSTVVKLTVGISSGITVRKSSDGTTFNALIKAFSAPQTYLVDAYLIYAASVLAANTVLRSIFGAA
jgi:hypothetical protein